ncbi:hypothetical protein V5O48_005973 [Marasmius crinis-equi]|uniref:Uncharacterized protein n=1 Tax=Marasmius crinis-equi TaxID=585013 RepID=A0ABR3FL68_9AGAR
MGMSQESRYENNLKVLRRRDPSIINIFDQFSHVCVYHHNGEKWEKHGYEGSMFLFERSSYPPYGFYILNRMGMDDYVQRLYPEDDIGAHGTYLMLRSYPEFTERRLAELPKGLDKFSDAYKFNKEEVKPEDKGKRQVIGLWMFNTDAREPMIDVMIRYIQRNVPYPDEFRYGPDRPPPPNPHLRTTANVPGRTSSAASTSTTTASSSSSSFNAPGGDLAALLAKLSSTSGSSLPPPPRPKAETKLSVDDLFASLKGQTPVQTPGESGLGAITPAAAASASTGIALLDSIFASAAPPSLPSTSTSTQTIATQIQTAAKPETKSHARTESTTSVSTTSTSSRSAGALLPPHSKQKQKVRVHSPQPQPPSRPNGVLTLTQAVVEGLLDGSGVGKGAFAGINGVDSNGNGKMNGHPMTSTSDDDKSSEDGGEDEEEILELDFADTRALSDMNVFNSRKRERERKSKGKEGINTQTVTVQAQKPLAAEAVSSPALDMLFSRSRPTESVQAQAQEGKLVNGAASSDHHDGSAGSKESDVNVNAKESILDALFANASRDGHHDSVTGALGLGAIQGKADLVKEVQRLLKHDMHFVDALWEGYEGRERGSGTPNSNNSGQKKRTRRRQGQGKSGANETEVNAHAQV